MTLRHDVSAPTIHSASLTTQHSCTPSQQRVRVCENKDFNRARGDPTLVLAARGNRVLSHMHVLAQHTCMPTTIGRPCFGQRARLCCTAQGGEKGLWKEDRRVLKPAVLPSRCLRVRASAFLPISTYLDWPHQSLAKPCTLHTWLRHHIHTTLRPLYSALRCMSSQCALH